MAGRFSLSQRAERVSPIRPDSTEIVSFSSLPPSAALPDLDGLVDAAADGERRGAVEVDGGGEVVVRVQPLLTTPEREICTFLTPADFTRQVVKLVMANKLVSL